jgi:hypothetical protein
VARSAVTSIRVTGVGHLTLALLETTAEVSDLSGAFRAIAARYSRLARGFAPAITGKLKGSIRAKSGPLYASVRAGNKDVPYAAVINYGWPKHNIEAQHFLQRADTAIRPVLRAEIDKAIKEIIIRKGLA